MNSSFKEAPLTDVQKRFLNLYPNPTSNPFVSQIEKKDSEAQIPIYESSDLIFALKTLGLLATVLAADYALRGPEPYQKVWDTPKNLYHYAGHTYSRLEKQWNEDFDKLRKQAFQSSFSLK